MNALGVSGFGGLARHAWLAERLARATVQSVALPFKLTMALTFRCHHRCGICGIWARDKGEEMAPAALDKLFASLPNLAWLDLTGGEAPAFRSLPALAESLQRHSKRLALLHFPTAGMIPGQAVAAARLLYWRGGPRLVVTVSFDGPQALHDELRGMGGAFVQACETWRQLRQEPGIQVFAGMTLQPANLAHWRATVRALQEALPGFALGDLHVNFLHRSPHYFANAATAACATAELRQTLRDIQAAKGPPTGPFSVIESSYLTLSQNHLRPGAQQFRSPIPCRSAEISAYIGPDGTVFPCTIDERPLGRLIDFDFNLAALWQSATRQALRAEIAHDRCPGCWTPCEAYQTLLTQPLQTTRALATRA